MIGDLTDADALLPLQRSGAQEAFSGVRNARSTLLAGFTTVRDVGTYRALVDAALRDAIADGTVIGPRMAVAGAYVTVTSGGGELIGAAQDVTLPADYRFGVANTADEVGERVRAILNGGADFIKIMATGAVLTQGTRPGASEYTEEQIRAAVEQAAEYGTYVTAHAHGAEGIKRAVRAGVRSIEHGSLVDAEAIALMKEKGAWLVADIYNGDYIAGTGREQGWSEEILRKNDETTEAQRAGFRKAVAAGVRIAYGTDSGVYPHRFVARQLPYMVRYGMTPIQALRSATLSAAELMGWEDRIGSLTVGKLADIIAVPGEALGDLKSFENVGFVMKGGVVYKAP
jgi:imidazolonepropionase-like amidohydrolase